MSKITENVYIQNFIKNNYLKMTDSELSEKLNVPKTTIQNYRVKNNLNKTRMGLKEFKKYPFEILVPTEYKNYSISSYGRLVNTKYNYVLTPHLKQGYYKFNIKIKGKSKYVLAHRLIAKAFIPKNNLDKNYINHIDGDKTNNSILNLEWCTIAENNTHAHVNGLISYDRTITKEDAIKVIDMINKGYTKNEIISTIPNMTKSIYYHIKAKRRWKNLSYLMEW